MNLEAAIERAMRRAVEDTLDIAQNRIAGNAERYSSTIARTLFQVPVEPVASALHYRGEVRSPFFWSTILEKGARRSVKPKGQFFAFFENPLLQDPRLRGQWHREYKDARIAKLSLDKEEFRELVNLGILVLTKVKPRVPAGRYTEKAMLAARKDLRNELEAQMHRALVSEVREQRLSVTKRVRF